MSNRRNKSKRRSAAALHTTFFAMQSKLYLQRLTAHAYRKGYALVVEEGTFHFVKVLVEREDGDASCVESNRLSL